MDSLIQKLQAYDEKMQLERQRVIAKLIQDEAEKTIRDKLEDVAKLERDIQQKYAVAEQYRAQKERESKEWDEKERSRLSKLHEQLKSEIKSLELTRDSKEKMFCILQGDHQGGGYDECIHVMANDLSHAEKYRKKNHQYNSESKAFKFHDIRHIEIPDSDSDEDDKNKVYSGSDADGDGDN